MNRSGIPYFDLAWNPFGFGCSKSCDGCWAKAMAGRMKCPKCRAFEPHFHAERLDAPPRRKKPTVIGVQFTGELFDKEQYGTNIWTCFHAMCVADWHQYIILTQQPEQLRRYTRTYYPEWLQADHIFWGVTVRNQAEADDRIPRMLDAGLKHVWVSYEPALGPVDFAEYLPTWEYCYDDPVTGETYRYAKVRFAAGEYMEQVDDEPHIGGVIVGCDNRKSAPFKLQWAESVVEPCRVAGVPVYVKQIRLKPGGKLLRELAEFPEHLQVRQLPWRKETP